MNLIKNFLNFAFEMINSNCLLYSEANQWAYIRWNTTQPLKGTKWGHLVETWINLETVTQSEMSQEEKNKYHILTHVWGPEKNGTDEPVCRAEIETQM